MNTALLSAYSSSLVPALYKYHRVDGSEVFPSGFPASHETLNRHNRPQLSDQLLLTLFGQVHSDDSLKHQTDGQTIGHVSSNPHHFILFNQKNLYLFPFNYVLFLQREYFSM